MPDCKKEAEELILAYVACHRLEIENVDSSYTDLTFMIPKQEGLNFDLELALSGDEFYIGYEGLWTYIFPFDQKKKWINELLNGIISGDCRLTNTFQFGNLKRSVLEHLKNDDWEHAYTAHHKMIIPFFKTRKDVIRNGYKIESFD